MLHIIMLKWVEYTCVAVHMQMYYCLLKKSCSMELSCTCHNYHGQMRIYTYYTSSYVYTEMLLEFEELMGCELLRCIKDWVQQ